MANYTIPENPEYKTEIRKIERTDPVNAETIVNPLIETMIENIHAVKLKADNIEVLQERIDNQQAELSGKAENEHQHSAQDISSGVLPISCGGTNGSTVAQARNNLGLGNTSGALPIANGGTGGTTGAAACANLGAVKKSGDTMTGILYAQSNTSYTTAQVRNIQCSTSDLTAGTSALSNGTLYFVYE